MRGTLEPCSTDTVHARPDRATIPPYRCCGEPDAHADARDATRHTPRRARGEIQCTPCTRSRRHRAPMCVCVALRDGRWDPHESRDQLICAVPNSFLRQLSGEAEQRARRDAPVAWPVGTGPRERQPAPAPAPRALRLCAPRPMCDDRTVYRNALACYFCGRKPRTSHRAGTGTILMSQPSWNSLVRGFCSGGLSPLRRELAPRRLTP